jgi:hypothetical protein
MSGNQDISFLCTLHRLIFFFFLKWGQKLCSNPLIKKKRIAQLINGKLGENRYNNTESSTQQDKPTSTHNLQQPQTDDTRTPHRKENHLNKLANSNGDH